MGHFNIAKGINLSHWLSQRQGWSNLEDFITKKDITEIHELGFDHVRLPIDEENLWDTDGRIIEKNFSHMIQCIEWSLETNIKIVIDVHIIRSHYFNAIHEGGCIELWENKAAQKSFLKLWIDLQNALRKYSNSMVAYELMNEPVSDDHSNWNNLLKRAYLQIRELEPNRTIIIGSNNWQNPATFPFLELPENAQNIILSCHLYEPLLFTHYKAYWLPSREYSGKIQYPGIPAPEIATNPFASNLSKECLDFMADKNYYFEKRTLQNLLQPAIDKAKELGFPLYCSEYGCLPSVNRDQRIQYYKDIIAVFNKNGISHCHWDYLGDFGARTFNRDAHKKGDFDKEITSIILT